MNPLYNASDFDSIFNTLISQGMFQRKVKQSPEMSQKK